MEWEPSIAADVHAIGRIAAVPTILQVVTRITGMRFAAVARVTEDSWTACAVRDLIDFGLVPGGQLPPESTFCNEIRLHHQGVVFGHASLDPRYANHPIPKMYGFESYISIPIFRPDGRFFGTLCALDPEPRKLDDPTIVKTFELFTQLIAAQLETEEKLAQSGNDLLAAHEAAKLREQFIAVLGHDLRSPLQAISMGAELLTLGNLEPAAQRNVDRIQRSCTRMAELIHDILDFARGRLGGGIPIALRPGEDIGDELQQMVSEVRAAHSGRVIDFSMSLNGTVTCDCRRIAQLFGNLLNNAIQHGPDDQPVMVAASSDDTVFELSVSNGGRPIPLEKRSRLFQPFTRSNSDEPSPGLGLGLYIAAEIAKAHHGTLQVSSSTEDGTRFVFRMPVRYEAAS